MLLFFENTSGLGTRCGRQFRPYFSANVLCVAWPVSVAGIRALASRFLTVFISLRRCSTLVFYIASQWVQVCPGDGRRSANGALLSSSTPPLPGASPRLRRCRRVLRWFARWRCGQARSLFGRGVADPPLVGRREERGGVYPCRLGGLGPAEFGHEI